MRGFDSQSMITVDDILLNTGAFPTKSILPSLLPSTSTSTSASTSTSTSVDIGPQSDLRQPTPKSLEPQKFSQIQRKPNQVTPVLSLEGSSQINSNFSPIQMTINAGTAMIDGITHSSDDEMLTFNRRRSSNPILSSKSPKSIIVSKRRTSCHPPRKSWPTASHSPPPPSSSPSVLSASASATPCQQQSIHSSHFFGSFRRRSSMLLSSPFGSDMSLNLIKEDNGTCDVAENGDCGGSSSDSGDSDDIVTRQPSISCDEDKEEAQTDSDQDSKSLTYADDRSMDDHDRCEHSTHCHERQHQHQHQRREQRHRSSGAYNTDSTPRSCSCSSRANRDLNRTNCECGDPATGMYRWLAVSNAYGRDVPPTMCKGRTKQSPRDTLRPPKRYLSPIDRW